MKKLEAAQELKFKEERIGRGFKEERIGREYLQQINVKHTCSIVNKTGKQFSVAFSALPSVSEGADRVNCMRIPGINVYFSFLGKSD